MTPCIMIFSIMIQSITIKNSTLSIMTLSIGFKLRVANMIMIPIVDMLSVVMLRDFMPSVTGLPVNIIAKFEQTS